MIPWWCWTAIGVTAAAFKSGFDEARSEEEAKQRAISQEAEEKRHSATFRLRVLLEEHLENFRRIIEAERVKSRRVIDTIFADMEHVAQFKEESKDLLPNQKRQITLAVRKIETALSVQESRLEKLEQADAFVGALKEEIEVSGPRDTVVQKIKAMIEYGFPGEGWEQ